MRVVFCVGCNNYDNLSPLRSAENDARSVFSLLTSQTPLDYDLEHSMLLLSPTTSEIRTALAACLYENPQISDFTFYFAGHAGVHDDSLYLTARDTGSSSISLTGISFAECVKAATAARPQQANFVIDACNSGGLGSDLSPILRGSLLGAAGSIGIAALASSAADQSSAENAEGGLFTLELLRTIRGDEFLNDDSPYLSIQDVATTIQRRFSDVQTASVWALNLQGPNRFITNPHYDPARLKSFESRILATQRQYDLPSDFVRAVRRLAFDIEKEVDSKSIFDALALYPYGANRSLYLAGLAENLSEFASRSRDPFARGRVLKIIAAEISTQGVKSPQISTLVQTAIAADVRAIEDLSDQLSVAPLSALMTADMSDIFQLPIRLAHILSVISIAAYLTDDENFSSKAKNVMDKLLHHYGNSIVALSEEQAVPYAIFLTLSRRLDWNDQHEEVIGRLFNDTIITNARIARHDLSGSQYFDLVRERTRIDLFTKIDNEKYARPSDLFTLIMLFSALNFLDDTCNGSLIVVDHTPMNFFIVEDANAYGAQGPLEGFNLGTAIGHGVWTLGDIRRIWEYEVSGHIQFPPDLEEDDILATAIVAHALNDRVPWHFVRYFT